MSISLQLSNAFAPQKKRVDILEQASRSNTASISQQIADAMQIINGEKKLLVKTSLLKMSDEEMAMFDDDVHIYFNKIISICCILC